MEKMGETIEMPSRNGQYSAEHSAFAGRRTITAALVVAMTVTAMEQLVVSPAMPTIIAKLKGFEIYPWVISAYLLAATVSTPIYGKLADLFGRKRVLLFGLGLFSLGSILSGTSFSMGQLIVMRTIQGLGAGAVGPIVLTMVGDLFSLEERARVQGLFSAVWGLSSVAGPLLGGYITDNFGWRWVFLVSVPFAMVAIGMLVFCVKEPLLHRTVAPIDWAGAALLTAGMSVLLWVVLDGSRYSAQLDLALLALSAALLVLFVIRERRAPDPILPMDLMARPTIAASLLGSFLIGGVLFGLDTYVPLFIQGVLGGDATRAGRALMPLFIVWAVSVALAARAVVHWGFRRAGLIGSALITLGTLVVVRGAASPELWSPCFATGLAIVGMGMGPTSLSFILAVQHSVAWGQRGVATGAVIFLRTIGGAIGVGLLGAALARELAYRLARAGASGIDVVAALRPETHDRLSFAQLMAVRVNLGLSLRDVFILTVALGAATIVCTLWLPNKHSTLEHSSMHERAIRREEILAATATEAERGSVL
jgi:EmrB/QacA subfamily drug resistance transporter